MGFLNSYKFLAQTSTKGFFSHPSFVRTATSCGLTDQGVAVKTLVGNDGIIAGRTEDDLAKIGVAGYGALDSCGIKDHHTSSLEKNLTVHVL